MNQSIAKSYSLEKYCRRRASDILKRCRRGGVFVEKTIDTLDLMSAFLYESGVNEKVGVCLIDKQRGYRKENIVFSRLKTWARSRNDSHGTSKYKGVGWYPRRSKWRARIRVEGKQIHLGFFESEEDAAKEYNLNAVKFFGSIAKLNDISINYELL